MNHVFRIVWNSARACFQAVNELACGHGAGHTSRPATAPRLRRGPGSALSASAIAAGLCVLSQASQAGPSGGVVTAGSATINQSGHTTTINQSSNKAAIDWTRFSVGANESVRFVQPGASAIALNRVTGSESSAIMGQLSANGQVFILNPNGVLFGAGAQVNVGGLVASTLRLGNAPFMAGQYQFEGGPQGSVVNQGHLTVAAGGTLALMAPLVQNTGTLSAPGGHVLMAAAQGVTLSLATDGGLLAYTLDAGSAQALVDNGGLIEAQGGHVVLSAKGVDALSQAVVQHSGVIEAHTVSNQGGVIELLADMVSGTVKLNGVLDASAPDGGDGGFVETSAAHVKVQEAAHVSTKAASGNDGLWLIDPWNFTIADSGGDITPSALAAELRNGSIGIGTTSGSGTENGDIFVNSALSWTANPLTLGAGRNIYINANLNGTGTASLILRYGQDSASGTGSDYVLGNGAKINLPAGQTFKTAQGSSGALTTYTVITELGVAGDVSGQTLQGMNGDLLGNYALGSDIDAQDTASWNANAGFTPIGASSGFAGTLAGLGHSVSNLRINRPTENNVGLLGRTTSTALIRDIGVLGGLVSGQQYVGALVGAGMGSVSHSHSTATVSGARIAGGLMGLAYNAFVKDSYATGPVNSTVGGAGGLIGQMSLSELSTSYATGPVSSPSQTGGLVGTASGSTIQTSFATGNVSSTGPSTGGLVGCLCASVGPSTVTDSYATGAVSSTGRNTGGLVGNVADGTVSNSHWDTQTSGQSSSSGGGAGDTTAAMQQQATYAGWDFVNTWRIVEGSSYPLLRALTQGKITLSAAAQDASKVYDKTAWTGGTLDFSGFTGGDTMANLSGVLQWVGNAEGAIDAGQYTLLASGLSSQKYEIAYAPGVLTILPRQLSIAVRKTFDGSASFNRDFVVLAGILAGDATPTLSGTATVSSADAGRYTAFSSNNLLSSNANYAAVPAALTLATITPATLLVTAAPVSKVYDGFLAIEGNQPLVVVAGQLFNGDTLSSHALTFADPHAGTGKAISLSGPPALAVNDGNGGHNYTVTYQEGSGTILPRPLDITVSKNQDGNATFTTGFTVGNAVSPQDTPTVTGSATVRRPDVGDYTAFEQVNLVSSSANYTVSPMGQVRARIAPANVDLLAPELIGYISDIVGTISIFRNNRYDSRGQMEETRVSTVREGIPVYRGDMVFTNEGRALLTLNDTSTLRLASGDGVELLTPRAPQAGVSTAEAILADGRLWARLWNSIGVHPVSLAAGVRG